MLLSSEHLEIQWTTWHFLRDLSACRLIMRAYRAVNIKAVLISVLPRMSEDLSTTRLGILQVVTGFRKALNLSIGFLLRLWLKYWGPVLLRLLTTVELPTHYSFAPQCDWDGATSTPFFASPLIYNFRDTFIVSFLLTCFWQALKIWSACT